MGSGPSDRTELVGYAARMIAEGSKSFARAAALMPEATRDSVYMLYAWCRHCDDVIDDQHLGFPTSSPSGRTLEHRVAELREKTRDACKRDGPAPVEPPFAALAHVVARHDIPTRFPLDLIDGFAMDAAEHVYRSEDDLLAYCYHVAGAVGVMMAMVMGVRDRPTLLRACDLGLAFQLTNISRDILADHRAGRIYLPLTWLDEAALDPHTLAEPQNRQRLFHVAERTLDLADLYYDSAQHGIARLPYRCAWSIAAARRIYRAIGTGIRRKGAAAWDTRVSTTRTEKMRHVTAAAIDAAAAGWRSPAPSASRNGLWTPPSLAAIDNVLAFPASDAKQKSRAAL